MKNQNRMFAAVSFFVSLVVYLMTMAPTVSFWDCGEFIACSYRLAVPHPPGAPLFLLVGRVFSLIPEMLIENIALRVNLISVLSSAFTILFLHLSIAHLIREYLDSGEGFLRYVPNLGALIGALTFAFSHSFWFNAVEAEVYAPSMFFTGVVVWLVFKWSDSHGKRGSERYILLIAYVIGLALGVHLLNVLAIPMIIMVIYYKRYEVTAKSFAIMSAISVVVTLAVYPGVVKYTPKLIDVAGVSGLALVLLAIFGLFVWAVREKKQMTALAVLSTLLIIVGYSSYTMIYVRSNLDPSIDENNPETIEKFISYLEREQYGSHSVTDREGVWKSSPNGKRYSSTLDFVWTYQIQHMYNRYFAWNFVGIENGEGPGASPGTLWLGLLSLMLGFIGAYYHFYRDWKHGLAIMALFIATGYAIIIYLNQPDPQPRERDYSYVGSFFAFAIWVGIGAAALLEWLARQQLQKKIPALAFPVAAVFLIAAVPMRMLYDNYESHDRSGNYVAWDYSYNMLIACDEGATMYTNGDNDTFPLWYLQEVEKVRTDVRVANLSLLNTQWYIEQIKNKDPKTPLSISDDQIENLGPYLASIGVRQFGKTHPEYGEFVTGLMPWPQESDINIPVKDEVLTARQVEERQYRRSLGDASGPDSLPSQITFKLGPKYQVPVRDAAGKTSSLGFLRVQDYMILNTLLTNKFEKPLYFAVTTSGNNQLDGLQEYLRMDGLLFKITTIKGWQIDPEILYDNLMRKFRYRNLDNPHVYYNDNILGLLQNYRSAFFRLANHYIDVEDMDRFREVVAKCYEVMPPEIIRYNNKEFENAMLAYAYVAEVFPLTELKGENHTLRQLQAVGDIAGTLKRRDISIQAYTEAINIIDNDPSDEMLNEFLRQSLRRPGSYEQLSADRRFQMIGEIQENLKKQLINAYKAAGEFDQALKFLDSWEGREPGNPFIPKERERIQMRIEDDE